MAHKWKESYLLMQYLWHLRNMREIVLTDNDIG